MLNYQKVMFFFLGKHYPFTSYDFGYHPGAVWFWPFPSWHMVDVNQGPCGNDIRQESAHRTGSNDS